MHLLSGSPSLDTFSHTASGGTWADYRATLHPRYTRIWGDIAVIWIMILAGIAAIAAVPAPYAYAAIPVGAIWLGFWLQGYTNYIHEAAHFNLAPRRWNDRLTRLLITPFCGMEVSLYRKNHWQHHLHLGRLADTEISYRTALTWRNILFTLSGLNVAKALIRVLKQSHAPATETGRSGTPSKVLLALGYFALVQLVITLALAFGLSFPTAIAWVLGQLLMFPFFAWLRQILEHRSYAASPLVDYHTVEHGPVTRAFYGRFDRYFGTAGFNRHLLHHWDPKISYSRFDDMERFLLSTPLAEELQQARCTYWQTFRRILTP